MEASLTQNITPPSPDRSSPQRAPPPETTTYEDMTMIHEPHECDWIVDAALIIPTHRPEACELCQVWADHARDCLQHSREPFERARNEAAQDPRHNTVRLRQEAEIRLDESRRLSDATIQWAEERGVEARRYKAECLRLEGDLAAALADLMAALDERDNVAERFRREKEEVLRLRDELRTARGPSNQEELMGPTLAQPARIMSSGSTTANASTGTPGASGSHVRVDSIRKRNNDAVHGAKGEGRKMKSLEKAKFKARQSLIRRRRLAATASFLAARSAPSVH
jgi:hypothetical protein